VPPLDFAIAEAGRPTYGLPTTRLVNAFIEATPAGPTKAARISRPGLTLWNTIGAAPILRIYQNPGIFLGDPFIVSQGELYRGTSALGAVPYSAQPRMAATIQQLALVVGGALFVYDGTALTAVTSFIDEPGQLPPFSGVAVLFNIFIYPVAGTTQYYWSAPGDATSISALNFASATTAPDPIVEVCTLSDELYFLKQANGTEIWDYNPIVDPTSGQITQPFQLSQGRTWIRGTPAQGSVVSKIDNAIIWVGDDLMVYRSGVVPQKISTPMIDDRLRAAKDTAHQTSAFAFGIEGHWFYVMNLEALAETYVYDCATQEWAQWGSQATLQSLPGMFIGDSAAGQGATIYVGDKHTNHVYLLDVAANTDGGLARAVVVSATIWVPSGTKRLNNLTLACVRGGGSETDNPSVWMRLSNDGGRTFTTWMEGNLGFTGQYTYKSVWRNLGVIQQPGVLIELGVRDSVPFVVEGGSFNVPRA
jgi:hypothetical protein